MGKNSARRITQLQATLSKMEVALGAIADAVVWIGEDMMVQWCNSAFASLVQQPHRNILKSKLSDILPLEQRGKRIPLELYPNVRIYQGEYETTKYHFQRPDGTLIVQISGSCGGIKQNKSAILIIREVTECEEVAESLQESEERLRSLIEATPDIICFKDGDGRWLESNQANLDFLQLSGIDYRGKTDAQLAEFSNFYRDALLNCQETDEEAWQHHSAYRVEETIPRPDGSQSILDMIKVPLFYPNGERKALVILGRDISNSKRTEAALQSSETQYRDLVETANCIILRWDIHGKILFLNKYGQRFFGFNSTEILDRNVVGTIVPETETSGRDLQELMENICQKPENYLLNENENIRQNGTRVWIAWANKPIFDKSGNLVEILSVGTDTTDRKRAEDELKESETRLIRILSSTLASIALFRVNANREWQIEYLSPGSMSIWGYSAQELMLNKYLLLSRINPEDLQVLYQESFNYIVAERNFKYEYQYQHPDGKYRWISLTLTSVRDDQTNSWIVTSVCTDITPRKRAEEAVRQSEAKYRVLYESIGVAIIIGNQNNIFTCNKAAEKLFGYSLYDMMGKHPSELSPLIQENGEDSFTLANQNIAIAFEKGNHHFQWTHRRADGTDFPVEIWLTTVEVGSEKLVQAIIYDLSERKEVEETLKIAKNAAESANRAKSAFLANMSHELRTPLNAIIGFAQLMDRDPALTPRQREFLTIINRSGGHLLDLINDVLEMSKIEAGRIVLNPAPFDLHYLLQTLREMFHLRTQAKKLSLEFDINPNLPQHVITDEGKLRQVLINLLGNAVKFTQTGGIILRAQLSQITDSPIDKKHFLNFEVEDTGRGIAPEEIDHLFQPFVQAHSGREAREGTGLGLTISSQFVQLMGGNINITSTPGAGSIFSFDLEVNLANHTETLPKLSNKKRVIGIAPDRKNYRILIVDDRQENRDLIAQLLNLVGFETSTASDGKNAIAIWQSWQPHLIWMDMRMPVMDGYEATKYIKAKERERLENGEILPEQKTVIIALSASAFEEQQAHILAAGCDDFVRKPFQEQIIFEKMAEHLGVKYIYAPEVDNVETQKNANSHIPNLTSSDLTVMPDEWIGELHQAATEVDADKITQLIEQIPNTDHTLVTGLTELLRKFCFDEILELLAPIFPPSPAD